MKHVLLDTTDYFDDILLEKPALSKLLSLSKSGEIMLYMSIVVKQELINHYSKRIEKAFVEFEKNLQTIRYLKRKTNWNSSIVKISLKREITNYRRYLDSLIEDNKIIEIGFPVATHETILNRAINRMKPFNSNGKGYQDTLIWMSIVEKLEYFKEEDEVVFISRNQTDFGENARVLANELKKDVESSGFDTSRFRYYSVLIEFFNHELGITELDTLPARMRMNQLIEQLGSLINKEDYRFILEDLSIPFSPSEKYEFKVDQLFFRKGSMDEDQTFMSFDSKMTLKIRVESEKISSELSFKPTVHVMWSVERQRILSWELVVNPN